MQQRSVEQGRLGGEMRVMSSHRHGVDEFVTEPADVQKAAAQGGKTEEAVLRELLPSETASAGPAGLVHLKSDCLRHGALVGVPGQNW